MTVKTATKLLNDYGVKICNQSVSGFCKKKILQTNMIDGKYDIDYNSLRILCLDKYNILICDRV